MSFLGMTHQGNIALAVAIHLKLCVVGKKRFHAKPLLLAITVGGGKTAREHAIAHLKASGHHRHIYRRKKRFNPSGKIGRTHIHGCPTGNMRLQFL